MLMGTITQKERLFIEAYTGDEVEAMQVAGFTGAPAFLKRKAELLLSQPHIQEAIQTRTKYIAATKKAIADREERQELWTAVMRNEHPYKKQEFDANGVPLPEENIPLPVRLKASEMLGKSEADFVERIDMRSKISISEIIQKSFMTSSDDLSIEDIEAQYSIINDKKKKEIEDNSTDDTENISLEDFI
jgi:hypothetical protein